MSSATLTLVLISIVIVMYITEALPLALTSVLAMVGLVVAGLLPPSVAFSGFSNPTTLLILFMSPVGEALFRTGVGDVIGGAVIRYAGGKKIRLIGATCIAAIVLSSVSSNTGTTVALLPLTMAVARKAGIPPSYLLIPLSFGASLGGNITLIGRAPNMIINGAASQAGLRPFGFFDFGLVGLPIAVAGTLYLACFGHRHLPARYPQDDPTETVSSNSLRSEKRRVSVAILAGTVVAMVFGDYLQKLLRLDLTCIAIIGAALTVLTGCITMREFFSSVDWTSIMLLAGLIPVGHAMKETGAADLIAVFMVGHLPLNHPYLALTMLFLTGGLLAQVMSHTAATSILIPVFLSIAARTGLNPRMLLMTIAISTGVAMATPIGTPPNTLVYSRGGYRFTDFLRLGTPMLLLSTVLGVILIPAFFG